MSLPQLHYSISDEQVSQLLFADQGHSLINKRTWSFNKKGSSVGCAPKRRWRDLPACARATAVAARHRRAPARIQQRESRGKRRSQRGDCTRAAMPAMAMFRAVLRRSRLFKSLPVSAHEKRTIRWMILFSWCRWRDLNPHALASTST